MAYTTIDNPADYFNTVLYTGNGSTQSITGVGFQPDWVWCKSRSQADNHAIFDSVRGGQKQLRSNTSDAELTRTNAISSFDSDGWSMGSQPEMNSNTITYASWNWYTGATASSNTDGSITSSVSANTTAGFSIVSYTGNGTGGATIGHGLGVSPSWIVTKKRSATGSWVVYHKSQGATKYGILDTTASFGTSSSLWNDTEPTSSVFSVGTDADTNGSSATFIAYCFAEKKGYSKFGKYRGNSSSDGVFVYLGFKPAMVMVKSNATEHWEILDNKRSNSFNAVDGVLFPNLSNAEETANDICDFLSNGIKFRHSDGRHNSSAHDTYYMAFAENPFVTSTGIPTTAR